MPSAADVLARLRPPGTPSRHRSLLLAVVLLATTGIVTVYASFHTFLDLEVYRLGVQQWLGGGDMYGTLPATRDGVRLPFIYPPFAALALSPIALIPWPLARLLNFGLAVAALGVTIYLCTRRLWPTSDRYRTLMITGFALPLALWLEPVRETIGFGQINLVLMALVAADCLAGKPRWPRGLLIGIAAAIKLTPAVFLLYFLLRRDFRAAVVTVVSGALATAIGFAVLPIESMRYWFGGFAGAAGVSGSPYATNQTIKAALVRLSLPPPVQAGLWLLAAAVVLVVAVAGIWWALRSGQDVLAMVITAGAGLVLSPTSWSHHWVWIAPALLAMVAQAARTRSPHWILASVATAGTFYLGMHNFFPKDAGREFAWSASQHILGNSYLLLALVLLLAWVIPVARPATAGR